MDVSDARPSGTWGERQGRPAVPGTSREDARECKTGLEVPISCELRVSLSTGRAIVACEGACVVGTAVMGPNRPGRGSHIATASFMVDPAHRGKGVGRALGEEMLGWARRQGYRGVQFNAVAETNAAAVHLWQSLPSGDALRGRPQCRGG